MRSPELFAIACAALIASAGALGQPRGAGAGAGPPIAPSDPPRAIGTERSTSSLDHAVQQRKAEAIARLTPRAGKDA